MDRYRLRLDEIELFASWAQGEGYIREFTKGDYEALRLSKDGKGIPLIFFWRKNKQYVTVQNPAIPLVLGFLRDKEHCPEKIAYLKDHPAR